MAKMGLKWTKWCKKWHEISKNWPQNEPEIPQKKHRKWVWNDPLKTCKFLVGITYFEEVNRFQLPRNMSEWNSKCLKNAKVSP